MTEREQAIMIANKLLDFAIEHPMALYVPGDPDCDVCILARQFLREIEDREEAAYNRQQERLMENGPGPSLLDQQRTSTSVCLQNVLSR